jgi:hypothetical protein
MLVTPTEWKHITICSDYEWKFADLLHGRLRTTDDVSLHSLTPGALMAAAGAIPTSLRMLPILLEGQLSMYTSVEADLPIKLSLRVISS